MSEPITPTQLGVLKNRVIWMASVPSVNIPAWFDRWWKNQDSKKMENAIKKLSKREAVPLVEAAITGDFSIVIKKMNELLETKAKNE